MAAPVAVESLLDGLSPLERAQLAGRLQREALKDKSYQLLPLGMEAAAYLRQKRRQLTKGSYRVYEATLYNLARHFPDLELVDFEPPIGAERLEEFLDHFWGDRKAATFNRNLGTLRDFFKWARISGRLHGDPTLTIERARTRDVYRTTFSPEQRRAIVASQEILRDRIALRLLLDYGIRKGTLLAVQFKHFDHVRKRLTIFAKGGKVRELPIPDPAFWHDLERHILDVGAKPGHYLLNARKWLPRGRGMVELPDRPMGDHGAHDWWYACLAAAGIVEPGTTAGEHMHKARHTAGQRVLDATGNLKATQALLGHKSIRTTADLYVDWDIERLAQTMTDVLADDEEPA